QVPGADDSQEGGLKQKKQSPDSIPSLFPSPLRDDQDRKYKGNQQNRNDIEPVNPDLVADGVGADPGKGFGAAGLPGHGADGSDLQDTDQAGEKAGRQSDPLAKTSASLRASEQNLADCSKKGEQNHY